MTFFVLTETVDAAFFVEPVVERSTISLGLYQEDFSQSSEKVSSFLPNIEQQTLPDLIDFPLEYDLGEYGIEVAKEESRKVVAVRMVFEISIYFDGSIISPQEFQDSLTLEYHYGPADFTLIDSKIVSTEVAFFEDHEW